MAHLWEAKHDYYCCGAEREYSYDSWDQYQQDSKNIDLDMNLLVRWDWKDSLDKDNEIDEDVLQLTVIHQRKGDLVTINITVNKDNESAITEWLKPRYEHLMKLWSPLNISEGG
jgi:hypothetical protein